MVIISGPSGAGKNTVTNLVLNKNSSLEETISCTTRASRGGNDSANYYFIKENNFKEKIKNNEFIEWAKVHDFFYGTLKSELSRISLKNKIPILVIDVQGALNIKKIFPKALLIFIQPASIEKMVERIKNRALISEKEIHMRLMTAQKELEMTKYYDHIIENPEGHPEKAAKKISELLNNYFTCEL